jgi:hypothetical protein
MRLLLSSTSGTRKWNPLIWQVIKARGVFVGDAREKN